jgi:hypothetical protein
MKTFSFQLGGLESEVVFRESRSALRLQEITGFDPAKELSEYMVFADEEFNIGDAWYCIDGASGSVYRISPEYGTAPEFINSNMEAFRASIEVAAKWSTDHDSKTIRTDPKSVDLLADALSNIDCKALESPEYHWAMLIDHIRQCASEEDDEMEFRFEVT